MRSAYTILTGKISRARPRRTWEDNIRICPRKTGGKVWIGFIWLRIGTGGGLSGCIKGGEFLKQLSDC
jgi:hypothetical protein